MQQEDFEGLFEEMAGLPVTIRLLDPPLHEFLPSLEDVVHDVERARIEQSDNLDELERTLERVHALQEANPMLGTRGVRLAICHPEIAETQVAAITRASLGSTSAAKISRNLSRATKRNPAESAIVPVSSRLGYCSRNAATASPASGAKAAI